MTHRGPFQPRRFCDSVKTTLGPSSLGLQVTIGRLQTGLTASFCELDWDEGLPMATLLYIYA